MSTARLWRNILRLRKKSGWWFQTFFHFHPYLGKIPILTNIFQMGWNHQPEDYAQYFEIKEQIKQMVFFPQKPTWLFSTKKIVPTCPQKESRKVVSQRINFLPAVKLVKPKFYGLFFFQPSDKNPTFTSGTYPPKNPKKKHLFDERNPEPFWMDFWIQFFWMYLGPLFHGSTLEFSNISTHRKFTVFASAIVLQKRKVLPLLPWPLRGCRWGLSTIANHISADGTARVVLFPLFPQGGFPKMVVLVPPNHTF